MVMSNQYFQFKQFVIYQDQCAMKVTTDACVFGACLPIRQGITRVLDIGAGTGLLSLMLAQRNNDLQIDAIELDYAAAMQTKENVAKSPFKDQINVVHADVREFATTNSYDLVICNPPFFQNSLLGDNKERNHARHDIMLTYDALVPVIKQALNGTGYACILLPYSSSNIFEILLLQYAAIIYSRYFIIPKEGAAPNRIVYVLGFSQAATEANKTIVIKNNHQEYTKAFISLLQPFYQYL